MAPNVVMASAVLDIPTAFVEVARRVQEGRFQAAPIRLGMKEGIVSFVLNPSLASRIPAPVLQEIEQDTARIRSGELRVPRGNF
jgi:basic membrane lipoprotein Med (substrate-binding protein (PBP1-ABC) superfamily)